MKIIHTGDWHIGKLVHGLHMTEDQRYILKQLVSLIEQEKPDVLIIAGDIYDRSVPPVEAVDLLDEVLSDIVIKHQTKVLLIAGNHDSPDRVGFANKMLQDNGLYISGNLSETIKPIVIEDEYGPISFYPIPYSEPALVREILSNDEIRTHDAAMKGIVDRINENIDPGSRNICIAHGYIIGSESLIESESERPLSIGGSDYVSVEYFDEFDYVALGHLHGPQRVKYDHIRYSGSLMKYSFSEANQKKSVTLIQMDHEGNVELEYKELKPIRDMRVIKGKLENLIDPDIYRETNTDDYIKAILTDRSELVDAISKLRAIYPNVLRMEKEQFEREAGHDQTSASNEFTKKNPLDLFSEFYENVSGESFSEEKKSVVSRIIDDLNRTGRNS